MKKIKELDDKDKTRVLDYQKDILDLKQDLIDTEDAEAKKDIQTKIKDIQDRIANLKMKDEKVNKKETHASFESCLGVAFNENTIAKTIQQQIGNSAFYMMGTKQLIELENGLGVRFTGSRKVNYIELTLNGKDLYDIYFYKLRGVDKILVAEHNDIYNDMLHKIIEQETGLYLSL